MRASRNIIEGRVDKLCISKEDKFEVGVCTIEDWRAEVGVC